MGATTSTRSPSASAVFGRATAATKRPFTAVAILRPPKPNDSSAAARVPGATSCTSSLRKIRIGCLRLECRIEDGIRHPLGERRRQKKTVPEQTVGMQHAAGAPHLRQVVGKSRAQIGGQLDDF